jgi:hypothetical protein
MRWLVGFVSLLLALGTLRVVGCGDDLEVYEYPRCLRDEHCDDGNACNIDYCAGGLCEHTEKPCEGDWHEDCADLETSDCDPDTGVAECTWDTRSFEGQSCCRREDRCCSPSNGLPICWTCCKLGGVCSAGVCVDESGYIQDCTKLPDYSNCEIGDSLGVCWEDACTVLDCLGVEDGTHCWFELGTFEVGVCLAGTCGPVSPSQ